MKVDIGRYTLMAMRRPSGEHVGRRMLIRLNGNVKMTQGKAAAQAAHAAMLLVGAHPHVPVIVLNGSKTKVEAMDVVVRDAGHTEVDPGTVTAGASWVGDDRIEESEKA